MKNTSKAAIALIAISMTVAVSAADAIKVGLAWEGKSTMAEQVTSGFMEVLKELAPQIEVEQQRDLKDVAALGEVVKRFVTEKKAVVLMRSSGAKYLADNKLAIPGFFGATYDPVELGLMKNPAAPEGNFTGVTYAIPYDTQFETFVKILPKSQRVLLLVQAGHPTSPLVQAGTKAACDKFKLEFDSKVCKDKTEVLAAAKAEEGKPTMILLAGQALFFDLARELVAGINNPVVSLTEKPVLEGALCGLVGEDKKLGILLAESLVEVVIKGKTIKDTPVKVDPKPQLLINVDTAKKLQLDIPYDILQAAKVVEKK